MKRIITELKSLLRDFVMIYGLTMIATLVFGRINCLDMELNLDYLEAVLLFSFAADLPKFVYVSARELTAREMLLRTLIHTAILAVVLMVMGYYIGMWNNLTSGASFLLIIIGVDVLVRVLSYSEDVADATIINEKLKERRERCRQDRQGDEEV